MYTALQATQNKIIIALTAVIFSLFLIPAIARGAEVGVGGNCATGSGNTCVGTLTCVNGTCQSGAANAAADPFGVNETSKGLGGTLGNQDFIVTITKIINIALSLLGIVAVVIVLIGGFKWMTAGGNDEKVTEGRKYITSGVIGLAIILSALAITTFAINSLKEATGSGTTNTTTL